MVEAKNILVGSTLARKKRAGQDYFNTDGEDANATYPLNPKNNGGSDGDPILGLYEFWRYDSISGAPKSTLMVRQGTKIWGIDARTGAATDLTGSLTLPTTGRITFQAFEGKVYWVSSNTAEGYNCWDGVAASATAIVNVAATFVGPITGVTGNVDLSADTAGTIGNLILLTGDGVKDLNTLVSDWNTANPSNTVTLNSANGADVPAAAQAMQLAGGENLLPPDGTPAYILAHGGRMWAWGVPGFPYRIYASAFFDPIDWASADFGASGAAADATSLDFDPFGDPQGITGAVSFQDRLYVFMQRAQFEVSGNTINNFVVKTRNRQIGCVAHHSIVPIGDDVIYASERGILRLSSTDKAIESEFGFISRPISSIWNTLIDRTDYTQLSAEYDEQENLYLLAVRSSSSTSGNDVILAYNVQAGVWSGTWEGHRARTLASYVIDGRSTVIVGREDGIISVTGEPSRLDLGEAFTARFRTGFVYPGLEIDKQYVWRHATVLTATESGGKGQLAITPYVDSKQLTTTTIEVESGKDTLGVDFVLGESRLGSGIFIPQTFGLKGQGYGLQLDVLFNTDTDIEVYGFVVEGKEANSPVRGGKVGT